MAGLWEELRIIVSLTLPYMLQMYVMQFVNRITLAFVGRYDPAPMNIAAASLGTMWSGVTGLSIGVGMNLVLGVYCSQNFGRGKATENGVVVRHALRVLASCSAFSVAMAGASAPLLGALGQPEPLLEPVRKFSLVNALSLPALWATSVFSTALASQHCQTPGMLAQVVNSGCSFCLAWALLAGGVGYLGIAIANALSAWLGLLCVVADILIRKRQSTVWAVPARTTQASGISLWDYTRSALPSAFCMWAEWWAAEILALLAGLLPGAGVSVAANGILFNTLAIFYMTFVAISRASSLRVGNLIGAKDPKGISAAVTVATAFTMALSGAVALLLWSFSADMLRLYTQNRAILREAAGANLGMVLSIPPYSIMMCMLGVLRCGGQQGFGALALLVSFYLVGIPTGAYLGLSAGFGLLGIWAGNVIALTLSALAATARVVGIDWGAVVERSDPTGDAESAALTPLPAVPAALSRSISESLSPCGPTSI
uniref:Protein DETOXIFICATION n=1 Tax=Alexandrium monilatum TaxID=311494 RepID=A0A7S4VP38_9DINO